MGSNYHSGVCLRGSSRIETFLDGPVDALGHNLPIRFSSEFRFYLSLMPPSSDGTGSPVRPIRRPLPAASTVGDGSLPLEEAQIVLPRLSAPVAAAEVASLALSHAEAKVLSGLGRGDTSADLAAAMNVSVAEIGWLRCQIMEKLNLPTPFALRRLAIRWARQAGPASRAHPSNRTG